MKRPVAAEHVHTNGIVAPGVVAAVPQNEGVGVKLMNPKLGVGGSKLKKADPKLNITDLKLKAVELETQLVKKGMTQEVLEGDASSSIQVDQMVITKENTDIAGKEDTGKEENSAYQIKRNEYKIKSPPFVHKNVSRRTTNLYTSS